MYTILPSAVSVAAPKRDYAVRRVRYRRPYPWRARMPGEDTSGRYLWRIPLEV